METSQTPNIHWLKSLGFLPIIFPQMQIDIENTSYAHSIIKSLTVQKIKLKIL